MKNTMKRIALIIATVSLVAVCFVFGASALETTGQCGDNVYWNFNNRTGELVISGTGPMWDYEDDNSPFSYNKTVKTVVIENGITKVGKGAFTGCGQHNVNFGEDVTVIGDFAFSGCSNYAVVLLPDNINVIGENAFVGCGMCYVVLGKGVTTIGEGAFIGLAKRFVIQSNIVSLTTDAFSKYPDPIPYLIFDCSDINGNFRELSVDQLTIGINVKNIDCDAFSLGRAGVRTIYYEGTEDQWNELTENWRDKNKVTVFFNHKHDYKPSDVLWESTHIEFGLQNLVCECGDHYRDRIPMLEEHTYNSYVVEPTCANPGYTVYSCECGELYESDYVSELGHNYVETILSYPTCNTVGQKQIYCTNCSTYKYESIPTNNEHIDNDKNGYCDRCSTMYAYNEGPYLYLIEDDKATIIHVDNSISGDVVIPSTLGGYPVTAIGDEAFGGCINITDVTIPKGVVTIGDSAFIECFRLKNIELTKTLETIGELAFAACLSLKEIVLPIGVTDIKTQAFYMCLSLEKIIFEAPEASIGAALCYTYLLPKDISTDEWVEKYIALIEAMINKAENAGTLEVELESKTTILKSQTALLPHISFVGYENSTAEAYAAEHKIDFKLLTDEDVEESTTVTDAETNVEIEFDNSVFETDIELIVSEEEVNANIVFGDEFENYKSYDISIVADGEKVQPDGYVTVKLPLPENFNAGTTVVYYVDNNGNKTKIDSKIENGFVVFETNHFSEYVLVDESSKIEPPHEHSYTATITKNPTCTEAGVKTYTCSCNDSYTEEIAATGHDFDGSGCKNCDFDKVEDCPCNCHKGGIVGFFFKLINFFEKLFGKNKVCACGVKH